MGTAGFCRIWIPEFMSLAKHFYEALNGPEIHPLEWIGKQQEAFKKIKGLLTTDSILH